MHYITLTSEKVCLSVKICGCLGGWVIMGCCCLDAYSLHADGRLQGARGVVLMLGFCHTGGLGMGLSGVWLSPSLWSSACILALLHFGWRLGWILDSCLFFESWHVDIWYLFGFSGPSCCSFIAGLACWGLR